MLVLLYNGEEAIVLIHGRIIHPRAMNKGNIYSLMARVSADTPQPDGSVVKTRCIQTWALYNHIPSGCGSQKGNFGWSYNVLYLSNRYQHNYDYQDIS
jgi:hypothetical protein